MLLLDVRSIRPNEVAVLMKPCVEMENLYRRPKAVVRGDDDGRLFSGHGHHLANELIDLAEVLETQATDTALGIGGKRREKSTVQKAPTNMLQLVDPIEENRSYVSRLLRIRWRIT